MPSELIGAAALRNAMPEFLANSAQGSDLQKFIRNHIDPERFHARNSLPGAQGGPLGTR
jgi:hypothetical protein